MPFSKIICAAVVSGCIGLAGQVHAEANSQDNKKPVFPSATGSNLNKKVFRLPQDFEGELNLVFMAFVQRQQEDVNTWLPMAAKLKKEHKRLVYYELPVIQKLPEPMQEFIDNGMRGGIPDLGVRAITITLYLDQKPFLKSLQIDDMRSIYAVLVKKDGSVLWKVEGNYTAEKEISLRKVIAKAIG